MLMKKIVCLICMLSLGMFFVTSGVSADDMKGRWSAGINFPGLSVKYGLDSNMAVEVKAQYQPGVTVVGPRAYYYFNPESDLVFFAGAEVDAVIFDTDNADGVGYAAEVFGGAEYFLGKQLSLNNLSLSADIGPAYIGLASEGLTEAGVDVILNMSINWYF